MSQHSIRVAIYARVSSEQQAKAATIDSQVVDLRHRISEDGHVLEEEFCFLDDGHSGSTLLRPALEQLRDVAYTGAIDRLYIHSPDRLARKYAYQVLLTDEFQKDGVEVVYLNHASTDSPEGELLIQVQGVIAEYERAKIMERSRRGKRHSARRGSVSAMGSAPYGYRYVTKQEGNGEARYDVVEQDSRIVHQMFEWIGRDAISITEVCRRLQQQGIKSPKGKEVWGRPTVWKMLKNPAYKGLAVYGKTRSGQRRAELRPWRGRDEHSRLPYSIYPTTAEEQETIPVPAIVSEDLFEAVSEQLEDNKRYQRLGSREPKYMLQGLLQCASCGYSCYGVDRTVKAGWKHYRYYRCVGTDAYRFNGQRICDTAGIHTDVLEDAVWNDVCALLREPERISQEYARRLKGSEETATLRQLNSLIQKTSRAIARLIDAYEDGMLNKDEFEPRIHASKQRLTQLREEQRNATTREDEHRELRLVIDRLEDFHQRISENLETIDWKTKREIIRSLVKRVKIDNTNVRVIYKIAPPPSGLNRSNDDVLQNCSRRTVSIS